MGGADSRPLGHGAGRQEVDERERERERGRAESIRLLKGSLPSAPHVDREKDEMDGLRRRKETQKGSHSNQSFVSHI